MAINLTAVVLYAVNIWLRANGPANLGTSLSTPVLLSIIGIALLFVSGWLGGQMVHVYGVGVEVREQSRTPAACEIRRPRGPWRTTAVLM
jgi:uncharacterized membrane protein